MVLATYDRAGADSAEAMYRSLRERYYGRAAYDFGDASLVEVAAALRQKNRLADAVRFLRLNVDVSPNSAFAHRQAADALLAAGDTAAARASLERAVTLNPNDQQAKRALDAIRPKP